MKNTVSLQRRPPGKIVNQILNDMCIVQTKSSKGFVEVILGNKGVKLTGCNSVLICNLPCLPLKNINSCNEFSKNALCPFSRWWACTCRAWAVTRCCRVSLLQSKWVQLKQTLTEPLPFTPPHPRSLSQCAKANTTTIRICL